jgi:hypothetical protein
MSQYKMTIAVIPENPNRPFRKGQLIGPARPLGHFVNSIASYFSINSINSCAFRRPAIDSIGQHKFAELDQVHGANCLSDARLPRLNSPADLFSLIEISMRPEGAREYVKQLNHANV